MYNMADWLGLIFTERKYYLVAPFVIFQRRKSGRIFKMTLALILTAGNKPLEPGNDVDILFDQPKWGIYLTGAPQPQLRTRRRQCATSPIASMLQKRRT